MEEHSNTISKLVLKETHRRLFDESFPRIKKCLNQLTEEETWHCPNEQTVSVGNLVLHLCGNARQWICGGMGNQPDTRVRQKEFDETGPLPKETLIQLLDTTQKDLLPILEKLMEADLLREYSVQGFTETGVAILIHVVEHFSYHTGQITWFVKAGKNIDMKYYDGINLDKTR